MITLLAVDCGFASVGYAEVALEDVRVRSGVERKLVPYRLGTIRTSKSTRKVKVLASDDDTRRARILSQELSMLMRDAGVVCAESLSIPFVPGKGGKGRVPAVKAAVQTAICWGVVVAHAQLYRKALLQATPQQVKRACCGAANASKDDVRAAMRARFGKAALDRLLDSTPHGQRVHAYDALAVACACIESDEVRLLFAAAATAPHVPSTGTGAE